MAEKEGNQSQEVRRGLINGYPDEEYYAVEDKRHGYIDGRDAERDKPKPATETTTTTDQASEHNAVYVNTDNHFSMNIENNTQKLHVINREGWKESETTSFNDTQPYKRAELKIDTENTIVFNTTGDNMSYKVSNASGKNRLLISDTSRGENLANYPDNEKSGSHFYTTTPYGGKTDDLVEILAGRDTNIALGGGNDVIHIGDLTALDGCRISCSRESYFDNNLDSAHITIPRNTDVRVTKDFGERQLEQHLFEYKVELMNKAGEVTNSNTFSGIEGIEIRDISGDIVSRHGEFAAPLSEQTAQAGNNLETPTK